MAEKLSYKEVYSTVEEKGYLLINKEYISNGKILDMVDKNNYIYQTRLSDLKYNKSPRKFSNRNEYTIDNIKNYLKINSMELELSSTEFIGSGDKLQFKTKEGYLVEISMENMQMGKIPYEFSIRNSNLEYNIKFLLHNQESFNTMKFIKYNIICNFLIFRQL